jgi:hypothetical protein
VEQACPVVGSYIAPDAHPFGGSIGLEQGAPVVELNRYPGAQPSVVFGDVVLTTGSLLKVMVVPLQDRSFIFARVIGPTYPDERMPLALWNFLTAATVRRPK